MKYYGCDFNKKLSDANYLPQNQFSAVDYWTKPDISVDCNDQQISFYQNLIRVIW